LPDLGGEAPARPGPPVAIRAGNPGNHWWELPGGGLDHGESLERAAIRETVEETGIELDRLGPQIRTRECRFRYRNRDHHRIDHFFLARRASVTATVAINPTENEKLGLIERARLSSTELRDSTDKLVPPELPAPTASRTASQRLRYLVPHQRTSRHCRTDPQRRRCWYRRARSDPHGPNARMDGC
jgi:8-oxo-dGTP pyrophosphatase MutT (NUDIX family)